MIFSAEKWKTEGVTKLLHASNALTWETMEPLLTQAWYMFIVPLMGSCSSILTVIFAKEKANRSELEQQLLFYAQSAVANLALWYNFTELNTRLTDQGHQRQETENFKSLFKYQENSLRDTYRNKGYNTLDALLELLDSKVDTYPLWKESTSYGLRKKSIVQSAKEVDRVVFINHSCILFLRFVPILDSIDQTTMRTLLGIRLHDALHEAIEAGTKKIGDSTVEELRIRVGRVMINLAAAELIRESGTLTDRGLYFESLTAGKEGDETAAVPGNRDRVNQAATYEQKAELQMRQLNNFISNYIPDLFAGFPKDAYTRDNDGKSSLWL